MGEVSMPPLQDKRTYKVVGSQPISPTCQLSQFFPILPNSPLCSCLSGNFFCLRRIQRTILQRRRRIKGQGEVVGVSMKRGDCWRSEWRRRRRRRRIRRRVSRKGTSLMRVLLDHRRGKVIAFLIERKKGEERREIRIYWMIFIHHQMVMRK